LKRKVIFIYKSKYLLILSSSLDQMYTKSSRGRLELDVESSRRENFTFAAKLVRGAYMISERKRAEEMGYPSPIHDTLEDTHASYNGGVSFLLSKINDHQHATREPISVTSSPIVFMVASHNRDSAMLTIDEMERNNVAARSGVVLFGQLYGMQDHISYTLANNGYSIFKYLPYGMIDEVIPYLLRRAQENSSVLGGVSVERRLMWDEVIDRLTGKGSTPATTADVSITGVAKSA
jgi:proline dehydrogenase